MPETPVDEDGDFAAGKHEIRPNCDSIDTHRAIAKVAKAKRK
jgi:hypothetical protein